MAGLRDIKRRINSVQSTEQITHTMEMVATAKIRHATERIAEATPYSEAMAKTLANVVEHIGNSDHPFFRVRPEKKTAIGIAIVSDRGLAGGFNSNVLRLADKWRVANEREGIATEIIVCGKKGIGFFHYRHVTPVMTFVDLSADPTAAEAREVASYARSAFEQEKADEVVIFYNHARNSADQDLRQETILPVSPESFKKEAEEGAETAEGKFASSSEFEPDAATVLDHLLPAYVQTMVYHALLDSAAAEQGARRKAMKSATDNASDMIFTLNRMYNRVRQGAITTEITEIVGGAAALEEE